MLQKYTVLNNGVRISNNFQIFEAMKTLTSFF